MSWLRKFGGIAVGYMVSEGLRPSYGWVAGLTFGIMACAVFVTLVEAWFLLNRLDRPPKPVDQALRERQARYRQEQAEQDHLEELRRQAKRDKEAPSGGIIASSISEQQGDTVVRTTRRVDGNYNTSRLRWQCLPAGTDPRRPGR